MKKITKSSIEWLVGKQTVRGYRVDLHDDVIAHVKSNQGVTRDELEDELHGMIDGCIPHQYSDLLAILVDNPDFGLLNDDFSNEDSDFYHNIQVNLYADLSEYIHGVIDDILEEFGSKK